MKLNAAQLQAFASIVREGSFDAAARKLHVTSSAVSQRLRQLEDRLGQVLVVRGAPCCATLAGQDLLRHALQIELLEKELFWKMGIDDREAQVPIRLAIAINADSLDGWFLDAFEETCMQASVTLDIRVDDQNYSASLLRSGEVMAAVSASSSPTQGCSVEYLGSMRYFALATPEFCDKYFAAGVNALTLKQAPILVYNAKDRMQAAFIEKITSDSVNPPSHFIPSTPGFVHITKRGRGWGMIPEHLARPYMDSGELVEIIPDAHFDIKLYWHRWQIHSSSLETLTKAVRSAAARLLI